MNLPIVTIFTKTDLIDQEEQNNLLKNFKLSFNRLKINRVPLIVKTNEDIVLFSRNINENIIPIFLVYSIIIIDI
jgi:GTPase